MALGEKVEDKRQFNTTFMNGKQVLYKILKTENVI